MRGASWKKVGGNQKPVEDEEAEEQETFKTFKTFKTFNISQHVL